MVANAIHASHLTSDEAEKIIARHIEASGGRNELMKMQFISRYGYMDLYHDGRLKERYCYHTDIIYPDKLREQIKGSTIFNERGTDGISIWAWTGTQYQLISTDKTQLDYMRDTAERANRDMLWAAQEFGPFKVLANAATWAPDSNQCIQALRAKQGIKRIYCFDVSTGLLNAVGSLKEYRIETDWRQVGNIKIPFRLTHYQNGVVAYDVQLDHAELNKLIPISQFKKPNYPQFSW